MSSRPTSADVAQRAGVSRTTVSFVLNNVPNAHIPEETRQRVLAAARELDYHPNAAARSLVRRQTFTVGLVLCQSADRLSTDAFLPEVVRGISSVVSPAGFDLLLQTVEDVTAPDAYMRLVREAHIDGIILSGPRSDDRQLPQLAADRFPVVLMGQLPGCGLPFVDVDNVSAARRAVDHLIALGHRRVASITSGPLEFTASADRLRGYREALESHGLSFDETLVRTGDHWEAGFAGMQSLLALPESPTAVFVASDVVALGALQAAKAASVRVPEDLALVGFDDIPLAQFTSPALTTVHLPARELGAAAARMVIDMVQTSTHPESILFGTQLVVRESCGALHGNVH